MYPPMLDDTYPIIKLKDKPILDQPVIVSLGRPYDFHNLSGIIKEPIIIRAHGQVEIQSLR